MRALRLRTIVIACAFGLAFAQHDSHAKGGGGCCSGNSGTGKNGMPGVTSNGAMGFGATAASKGGKGSPAPSPAPAPSASTAASSTPGTAAASSGPVGTPNGAGDPCEIVMVPWPGIPGLFHLACK